MNLLDGAWQRWDLWSTEAFLTVAGASEPEVAEARAALEPLLEDVSIAASRFRADSDVARLAVADGAPVDVSPMLLDLLGVAVTSAQQTDGLVDPALGSVLVGLGYDRDIAEVQAAPRASVAVTRRPDWRDIDIDAVAGTVRVPAGCILDLGATAKARAADLGARLVAEALGRPTLLSLGGDVAIAGTPEGSDGWRVTVAETRAGTETDDLPAIAMRDGGVATSTTMARRWGTTAGAQAHHLIDPRTLSPAAAVWRTVTVAAATCTDANTASTASVILGDSAVAWLTAHGLPARLVAASGDVVTVGDWPRDAS